MTTEQNKSIERRIIDEAWGKGNLDVLDNIIADSCVFKGASNQEYNGPEGLKQDITMIRNAFPDFYIEIDDQIAEGDKVVSVMTWSGTFKNEMMGIPPTGKKCSVQNVVVSTYKDGKAVGAIEFADNMSMFQQLGIHPPQKG